MCWRFYILETKHRIGQDIVSEVILNPSNAKCNAIGSWLFQFAVWMTREAEGGREGRKRIQLSGKSVAKAVLQLTEETVWWVRRWMAHLRADTVIWTQLCVIIKTNYINWLIQWEITVPLEDVSAFSRVTIHAFLSQFTKSGFTFIYYMLLLLSLYIYKFGLQTNHLAWEFKWIW